MPVSFAVAAHRANPVSLTQAQTNGLTPDDILKQACRLQYATTNEILQSCFSSGPPESMQEIQNPSQKPFEKLQGSKADKLWQEMKSQAQASPEPEILPIMNVIPKSNGFVDTVIDAYNKHHALVIRPDDVWLTILVQFNYFVNANAELLRANFVAHEGKRELEIVAEGTRYTVDFGSLSRQMVDIIHKNVVDPSLRDWVLPSFSTTTLNDTTACAVTTMATLKAYFDYSFISILCGIPYVTLEGTKKDWENILGRLEKLKEYGIQTIAWYHLLVPVISRFVQAFDRPQSSENVDFWQQVAHFRLGGSGPPYYSGWICAFCVFSDRGKWLGHRLKEDLEMAEALESLSAEKFWSTYSEHKPGRRDLVLDGTCYHSVDSDDRPPSYAEVGVKLVDAASGETLDSTMIAGLLGTRVSSSGDTELSATGQNDTVRPVVGWLIFTNK